MRGEKAREEEGRERRDPLPGFKEEGLLLREGEIEGKGREGEGRKETP